MSSIIIVAVVIAVVIVIVAFMATRRISDNHLGGPGQTRALQRALISGVPPDDIERDKWIAHLQRPPTRSKLVLHAAVVAAVMLYVLVDNIGQPGPFGWGDLRNVALMALAFAIVYGVWGRVVRGSVGWDQPPKDHLLATLKADASARRQDDDS